MFGSAAASTVGDQADHGQDSKVDARLRHLSCSLEVVGDEIIRDDLSQSDKTLVTKSFTTRFTFVNCDPR